MKKWIFVFAIIFLASANDLSDDLNELRDKAISKIPDALEHLPSGTLENLPTGFNASDIPSIEEGEELLKEKCDKNGNNESFDNAMVAKEEIQFCLRNLVNFTEIQKEIEKAKPVGDLDTVFRKYCRKSPKLRDCVNNFTTSIEPCLDSKEKETKRVIINITDALLSFICFKEGDRIALFIAEGGPDCLTEQKDAIQNCINSSFSKYLPKEGPNMSAKDVPSFKLEENECRDINILQKCVVSELERCKEPTPANIVDSLFNFVRKVTPCAKFPPEQMGLKDNNSASLFTGNAFYILSIVVLLHTLLNLAYKF